MKYTEPGNSDPTVSRICTGCGGSAHGQYSWTVCQRSGEILLLFLSQTFAVHRRLDAVVDI